MTIFTTLELASGSLKISSIKYYSGLRSMSIGGRSMMGDSFCASSYDTDENNSGNYIYIERKKQNQVYEDPFSCGEQAGVEEIMKV